MMTLHGRLTRGIFYPAEGGAIEYASRVKYPNATGYALFGDDNYRLLQFIPD